jgi:hypothetical protein
VVRPVLLALFDFAGGAVRVWSGMGDLTWDGRTWIGVGTFGEVGPIEETTEVRATGALFQLSGVPSGLLNEVVGVSVQGRRARLPDWPERLDRMVEAASSPGGSSTAACSPLPDLARVQRLP